MFSRNLWKISLSLLLVVWAVSTLYPLKDQPFADYARSHAGAKPAEFAKLLDEAAARKKSGAAPSEFVALKQIGRERKLDLSQYFPAIKLEDKLKNVEKRNTILLTELLARSKSKLQLGLDLMGGISVTLEVDPVAAAKLSEDARKEKLSKAIDIIAARINSFGIAEPVIRAVGENRIEIQLANINTKDNPDVVDNIKKPARLDFRTVHPTLSPEMVAPGEIPPGYEVMTLDFEGQRGESVSEELFVKRIPEMGGRVRGRIPRHARHVRQARGFAPLHQGGRRALCRGHEGDRRERPRERPPGPPRHRARRQALFRPDREGGDFRR